MAGARVGEGAVGRSVRPRLLQAAFIIAIAVQLVPIVVLDVYVTVDGPLHLAHATALWNHWLGWSDLPARYATVELLPATNLVPELPLGLLAVLLGPGASEKLVIGAFVAGFPLAVAWAIRGIAASQWWLAFLAIPITVSFALLFGFLNYVYGVLGLVLVAGMVARHRNGWSGPALFLLAVLLTATYAAHVLPFVLALLLLGLATLVDWRIEHWQFPDFLRGAALLALAAAPGLLLATTAVVGGMAVADDPRLVVELDAESRPLIVTAAGLFAMSIGLAAFDIREVAFTAALAGTLALLALAAAVRRPRPYRLGRHDAYLAFAIAVVGMYFVLDDGATLASGGGFLRPRLAIVPVLGLLLWLAATRWPPRAMAGVVAVSLVATLGLTVLRWPWHVEMSDRASAYTSVADCLARDATFVQVNLAEVARAPLERLTPLGGESGRLAAMTGGWDIANLGFAIPYFPLRNREPTDPYLHLATLGTRIHAMPPDIDPLGYEERTPGRIDYVLVYGRRLAEAGVLADPRWGALEAQLSTGYRRVAESTDGLLEVHERLGSAAAEEGVTRRARLGSTCSGGASVSSSPSVPRAADDGAAGGARRS